MPPRVVSTHTLPGLLVPAAPSRSRRLQTPPVAGATAAVIAAVPRTRPVALATRTVTVPPATELVPLTRKSPLFHVALLMVTRAGTGVTLTSSVRTSVPTVTVSRKVSGLLVIGVLKTGRLNVGLRVLLPLSVTLSGSVGLVRTCAHW